MWRSAAWLNSGLVFVLGVSALTLLPILDSMPVFLTWAVIVAALVAAVRRVTPLSQPDWSRKATWRGPLGLAVAAAAFLAWHHEAPYPLLLGAIAFIYATVSMANNLTSGLLGAIDLSAAGTLAVGAYAAAVTNVLWGLPTVISPLVGLAAGALVGLLISLASRRLRGNEVAVATLGVTAAVQGLLVNLDVVGGPDGIGSMVPWSHSLPWLPGLRQADFAVCAVVFIATWTLFRNLRETRHWRAWIALGDDEPAAMACGVRPAQTTRSAFVLAGGVTGFAGAVYAHVQQHIAPGNFGLMESILIVCAVMLGGRGNLAGPSIAAAVLWILPEQLQFAHFARMLAFGALLIVMLRVKPSGLLPMRPMAYSRDASPQHADSDRNPGVPATLKVEDLGKSLDGFEAVVAVSFTVGAGGGLAIVGSNGAGKTLTLDMLTGYLVPSRGKILLNDRRIEGLSPEEIARSGVRRTFQESRLFARMSVLEHALMGAYTTGRASLLAAMVRSRSSGREERAALASSRAILSLFGSDRFLDREDHLATTLSFGNRRRLEMVRCLGAYPLHVLLLDEPFVGMPADDRVALSQLLREKLRNGIIVAAEHNRHPLEHLVDSTIQLEAGRIMRDQHSVDAHSPATTATPET